MEVPQAESPTLIQWKTLFKKGKLPSLLSTEAQQFFEKISTQGCNMLDVLLPLAAHGYARKLIKAELNFTKMQNTFFCEDEIIPLRTMILFYAGKLFGKSEALKRMSTSTQAAVELQHLSLGFAMEFLFLSQLLHHSISDDPITDEVKVKASMIKTLTGDFLITQFYSTLASIRSTKVFELMGNALAGICDESVLSDQFIGVSAAFSIAFKSAAILSGHDDINQCWAETIGSTFGQAYEIYQEIHRHQSTGRTEDFEINARCTALLQQTLTLAQELFPNRGDSEPFLHVVQIMEKSIAKYDQHCSSGTN